MDPIYVIGHRNPDTDSIVSAMAYAALRNSLGDREFVAGRLGHLSDETKKILSYFGVAPPVCVDTMRTQVRDLDYDMPPALNAAVTLDRAWSVLQDDTHIPAIPVTTEDGSLYGMLSAGDIAAFDMQTIGRPVVEEIPVFNLLSVLEGKIINESANLVDVISGEVVIALPQRNPNLLFSDKNTIVIVGRQPDMIQRAIELGVSCVIICQDEIDEQWRNIKTNTCIISTPYDAARAARLIYHATPIGRVCLKEDLQSFHLNDFIDDVKEIVLKSRYRNYPILDENEKVVGTLSRFHLIRPRRKRVVLVDHNEASQSIRGLEQAEILEIIDHHRLADIQTTNPIYFRNEPVGSTATIIAGMYQERGLMPSSKLAGLLAAAIISDTVMFKSPTATDRDRRMAERMARIANVTIDQLGQEIFTATISDDKPASDLLLADFKDFHIAGHDFGVSQIICVDACHMLQRKQEFLDVMQQIMDKNGYSMVMLMLTDVLTEGTQLIYLGDEETIQLAFNTAPKDNTLYLPGVISRKKQVIPMLSALWG